jgi:hypothetical protein
MSILYYILGIIFFVVIIAICIVNISNYIEILNVADEQGTGDKNTGLSYSWVQTLIVLNVIVGVISLVIFSYCISVLFIGEPINNEPIDLTNNPDIGEISLEVFIAEKYFEETKKKNPYALRDAGKYATQELALSLYNEGYSGDEALKKADMFMTKYIKDKFPNGIYNVTKKFIDNEEYEKAKKELELFESSKIPNKILIESAKFNINQLENTKIIVGKPLDVIIGAKDAYIPWYKKIYSYLIKQPYNGIL